jgi:hypothetical protein
VEVSQTGHWQQVYMNTLHYDKSWAWLFAVLWWPFLKWRLVEILRCRESIQNIIIYLHTNFKYWIFAVLWRPFWKFWQRRIAPLMVTYHYIYVKFYVSIIIHLEVININVRNFNSPIGFYCNPTPFEPLKIWLWPP